MTDGIAKAAALRKTRAGGLARAGKEIRWAAGILLVACGFQSLVAKPFYIPSESMMPTLVSGDRLIVTKYPYGWSWTSMVPRLLPRTEGRIMGDVPKRGDIVTVTPRAGRSDYIKRVVGIPGDTVEVRHGRLLLNGKPVGRSFAGYSDLPVDANLPCTLGREREHLAVDATGAAHCRLPLYRETLPGGATYLTADLGYLPMVDDYPAIRVAAGHVFLMGDNRDQSADSRVPIENGGLGGAVPVADIGGRADIITVSMDGTARLLDPVSWFRAIRPGRAGESLHPEQ